METEDLEFKDILKHLDRESAHFVVRLETHARGRLTTVIECHSLTKDKDALLGLAHRLKQALATGGTVKGDEISLQGDQRERVKTELVKLDFAKDEIEVI